MQVVYKGGGRPQPRPVPIVVPKHTNMFVTKRQHAPDRDHLQPAEDFGVTLSPEAIELASDPARLARAYGGSGIVDVLKNRVTLVCSLCATTGGLLFGFVSTPPGTTDDRTKALCP